MKRIKKLILCCIALLIFSGCGPSYKDFYNEAKNSDKMIYDNEDQCYYSKDSDYIEIEGFGSCAYMTTMTEKVLKIYIYTVDTPGSFKLSDYMYAWLTINSRGESTISLFNNKLKKVIDCYSFGFDEKSYTEGEISAYKVVQTVASNYVEDIYKY